MAIEAQQVDPELVDEEEEEQPDSPPATPHARVLIATALPIVGSAVMLGGLFKGVSPRIWCAIAGCLGMLLAVFASRIRRTGPMLAAVGGGIFLIGVIVVVPSGVENALSLQKVISAANKAGELLRPPVTYAPGWRAITAWVMALGGYQAAWIAINLRKPLLALLVPMPITVIGGISIPDDAQVASGLAVFALFAIALGLSSSDQAAEGDKVPTSFLIRKSLRGLPMVAGITLVALLLTRAGFLFPDPVLDAEQQPQKPKTIPLSNTDDRILFEVESVVTGPWRIGSLDVYDGTDWRLPPFAQSRITEVSRSGIIDKELQSRLTARFRVAGLGGAVLPTLPNTTGIVTTGSALVYDKRNANIRLLEGQVEPGIEYTVTAAGLPSEAELIALTASLPKEVVQFAKIESPPPAVRDLISQAPSGSKWEQFDFLRTFILDNVVASGSGAPKSVTPERVADMIAGSKEGSPFEIVAAQAMLARWIGIPSRIGYGFDGGERVGEILQVRPSNGAAFVEVYFPRFKWLPVIGKPKLAKATTKTGQQQVDAEVLPSDDLSVRLVFPVVLERPSILVAQVRRAVTIVVPFLLLAIGAWLAYPSLVKARRRSLRRGEARHRGPRARIALAYAEWRDTATDLGCLHPCDTPLMFVRRFARDDEHREFAWLVTRALWGDLKDTVDEQAALRAEEMSKSLRRRIRAAQPATVRAIGAVSRLSIRNPYIPDKQEIIRGAA